ncbi:Hypp9015 [Branchiostoma lanceolatum]|uniref:Hypp9015 protein n=1 Tax=Branchiostoma lanceolatum TaxID=7740 RepID=A0A8J9ZCJ9_BRALA|nr:Hypp9015 [Branchiostoma lanceolatum]
MYQVTVSCCLIGCWLQTATGCVTGHSRRDVSAISSFPSEAFNSSGPRSQRGRQWQAIALSEQVCIVPRKRQDHIIMGRTFFALGLGALAMLGLLTSVDAQACPGRYKGFNGACFGFFGGGRPARYPDAVRFCTAQGAELYMMRDPAEVIRLKQLLSKQKLKSFWVGLTEETAAPRTWTCQKLKSFWVGLTEETAAPRAWTWSNGDALGEGDYTDWGEPADNTDMSCAYARKENGYKWSVTSCGDKKAFICKKDP